MNKAIIYIIISAILVNSVVSLAPPGNVTISNGLEWFRINWTIPPQENYTIYRTTNLNLTDQSVFGELWNRTSGGFNFDIAISGIYYNLTNLTCGEINGITCTSNGVLSYFTILTPGNYSANLHFSGHGAVGGGKYGIIISKNFGQVERNCYINLDGDGDTDVISITCIMDLIEGDNVSIQIEDESAPPKDFDVHSVNLNIKKLDVVNISLVENNYTHPENITLKRLQINDTLVFYNGENTTNLSFPTGDNLVNYLPDSDCLVGSCKLKKKPSNPLWYWEADIAPSVPNLDTVTSQGNTTTNGIEIDKTSALLVEGELLGARELICAYGGNIIPNSFLEREGLSCTGSICYQPGYSGSVRMISWGQGSGKGAGCTRGTLNITVEGVNKVGAIILSSPGSKRVTYDRYEYNFTSTDDLSIYYDGFGSCNTITYSVCVEVQYNE